MTELPRYLNRREAGTVLGVAERTLEKWAELGIGPPQYKLGKAIRYDLAELIEWVKARHAA